MAESNSVDLGSVTGTGAAGRIHKTDVESAIASPAPAATPAAPAARRPEDPRGEKRVRMSKRRATIARRLVEAQRTAAMLTTFNEVDMSAVMALRERHKEAFKAHHGVGLGIASFFVKAATSALRAFPQLNAEIQGDEIVYKSFYDIGIAVGAEGGLVVPVLRNADAMSFSAIEGGIRDFAKRAQDGSLTLEDLAGRHLHHHQRRRLRLAAQHPDPEPAPGGHPGAAQDSGPAGGRPGTGGRASNDVHRLVL